MIFFYYFFFQAEDGIRDLTVTGVQTCALPIFPVLMLSLSLSGPFVAAMRAQQTKRSFTVADDIGFTHFVSGSDPYGSAFQIYAPAQFSPNGELLAVLTARGRLDVSQVEESLRFYRTQDIDRKSTRLNSSHSQI